MVITRTPFRISFFGGGTDYPGWYKEHGGQVLSSTINRYCHITCRYLPPFFDYKYLLRYYLREETNNIADIKHNSVRECLNLVNLADGIELVHTGDVPAQSGIGSSSSFTVGLLHALYALKGEMITKRQLALRAIEVEQRLIGENVGSQDQVAAAFGGFNRIEFGGDREFFVTPVTINAQKLRYFQDCLMFFFTGISRNSTDIAGELIKNTPKKKTELGLMSEMVNEAMTILNGPIENYNDFGKLLNETWKLKRGLTSKVSSNQIDYIYEAALSAGALGGKLCGAGGGGFLFFFVPPEKQPMVREKLKDFLYVPIRFDTLGTHIILYSTQDVVF
ncbi:GHMP family kinase ATP-binding protein [Candidatus Magnetomonas plexicatena]|uniref:GHMP family kinase ATP-binding protein n=1 Tax=Candidatus Magnetomonas plexicatena TaxID=2552947 RepID=UPI001101A916|nr:kinase [Nitrospirales bacterium LBB_01]